MNKTLFRALFEGIISRTEVYKKLHRRNMVQTNMINRLCKNSNEVYEILEMHHEALDHLHETVFNDFTKLSTDHGNKNSPMN